MPRMDGGKTFLKHTIVKRAAPYLLIFYSLVGLLAMGAFFNEGIAFFSDHPTTWMNDWEFLLTFVTTILSIVCFLILVHRNFKIKIHWGFAILFTVLFLCNVVALFNLDLVIENGASFVGVRSPYLYTVSAHPRLRFILSFGVSCLYLYLFFAVFPRLFHNIRRLHVVAFGALLAMVAAIVYSLIVEGSLYRCLFDTSLSWTIPHAKSFTNNPNTFSFFFSIGAIGVMILHNRRAHWYWPLVLVLIFAFALMHASGTGVVSTGLIVVSFFIMRFVRLVKVKPILAYIGLGVFVVLLGTLVTLVLVDAQNPVGVFHRFLTSIRGQAFGPSSVESRSRLWQQFFAELDTPMKWAFGLGDQQIYYHFGSMVYPNVPNAIFHAHNGFFHQIYAGGIIRLVLYLALIVRFYVLAIDMTKTSARVAWPCMVGMAAVLLRSLFETNSFLAFDTNAVITYLLLILPVEVNHFLYEHPEIREQEDELVRSFRRVKFRYPWNPAAFARVCFFFLTPIAAMFLGAVPVFFHMGYFSEYGGIPHYVLWLETFVFLPWMWFVLTTGIQKGRRVKIGVLFTVLFLAVLWLGLLLQNAAPFVAVLAMLALPLFVLVPEFVLFKKTKLFAKPFWLRIFFPHAIMLLILIALCLLGHVSPKELYSNYDGYILMIAVLVTYFGMMYLPFADRLCRPIRIFAIDFDTRRTVMGIRKERMIDRAEEAFMRRR